MKFYQFPNSDCFPTVCYFSREKPLVKPTAPGLFPILFAFSIYFTFAFIFRSIKPKIQKYLAAYYFYLFYLAFDLSIYYKFLMFVLPILRRRTPKGIDNPFNTAGCEWLLFVCRGCLRCVAWFSYWFDNLSFISEGNTYRRCAASSLPLWGNTNVASSDINHHPDVEDRRMT